MTDQEIIQKLIERDSQVTRQFFFTDCRPLFSAIISRLFDQKVDYNEFVNELYLYLMADDAARLRNFGFRSSLFQWIKVVAIRFFQKKRRQMRTGSTADVSAEDAALPSQADNAPAARADLERLIQQMNSTRYASVIRHLMIEDQEPAQVAHDMGITTDNLYNLKRRAMAQLARTAQKDISNYGK